MGEFSSADLRPAWSSQRSRLRDSGLVVPWPPSIRFAVAAGALLAISALLRLSELLHPTLYWDEALYALVSRDMLSGHTLYTGIWDHKPPGIYLVYALAFRVFGESPQAVQIAACLAMAATAVALYALGSCITGDWWLAGTVAALGYLLFARLVGGPAGANAEVFLAPFTVFAFLLLVRGIEDASGAWRATPARALLIGGLLGLSIQIKPVAVTELIVAMILVSGNAWRRAIRPDPAFGPAVHLLAWMSVGALVPQVLVIAYFGVVGHVREYVDTVWRYNAAYPLLFGFSSRGFFGLLRRVVRLTAPLWLALPLLAVALLFGQEPATARRHAGRLIVWLGGAAAGVILLHRAGAHYYLTLLPPLCAMAGLAVAHLWRMGPVGRVTVASIGLVTVVVSPPGILPSLRELTQPASHPAEVALYLRSHLAPGDSIYVVNWEPLVYLLVDASVATRYPFPMHLGLADSLRPLGVDRFAELAAICRNARWMLLHPGYEVSDDAYLDAVRRCLESAYEWEATIHGVEIHRRRSGDEAIKGNNALEALRTGQYRLFSRLPKAARWLTASLARPESAGSPRS